MKSVAVPCPACGKLVKNQRMHDKYCPAQEKVEMPEEVEVKKPTERLPGSHIYSGAGKLSGKVPWTHKKCEEAFGIVEYTPDETLPVTYNGVRVMCFAGLPMLMPGCHKAILERRKQKKQSGQRGNRDLQRIGVEDMGVLTGRAPGAEED